MQFTSDKLVDDTSCNMSRALESITETGHLPSALPDWSQNQWENLAILPKTPHFS